MMQDEDEAESTRRKTCRSEAGGAPQQHKTFPPPVQNLPTGPRSAEEVAAADERREKARQRLVE
eukprot:1376508-Rhodomonas_salina.1